MNKELKGYIRLALKAGWRVKKTKDGVLLIPKDGHSRAVAIHPGQSTRGRSLANLEKQLREGGLEV